MDSPSSPQAPTVPTNFSEQLDQQGSSVWNVTQLAGVVPPQRPLVEAEINNTSRSFTITIDGEDSELDLDCFLSPPPPLNPVDRFTVYNFGDDYFFAISAEDLTAEERAKLLGANEAVLGKEEDCWVLWEISANEFVSIPTTGCWVDDWSGRRLLRILGPNDVLYGFLEFSREGHIYCLDPDKTPTPVEYKPVRKDQQVSMWEHWSKKPITITPLANYARKLQEEHLSTLQQITHYWEVDDQVYCGIRLPDLAYIQSPLILRVLLMDILESTQKDSVYILLKEIDKNVWHGNAINMEAANELSSITELSEEDLEAPPPLEAIKAPTEAIKQFWVSLWQGKLQFAYVDIGSQYKLRDAQYPANITLLECPARKDRPHGYWVDFNGFMKAGSPIRGLKVVKVFNDDKAGARYYVFADDAPFRTLGTSGRRNYIEAHSGEIIHLSRIE